MNTEHDLRTMTEGELALLAAESIAYVKPVEVDGKTVYAIHGADGRAMGWAPDRELAFAALKQQDIEPASVH